jgi:SAM-dependent methyltransferase
MAFCSICQHTVNQWLPHPHRDQRSPLMTLLGTVGSDLTRYACPVCHSNDRLRHLWLYMAATGLRDKLAGAHILHIAPEPELERLIAALGPDRYVRGDLHPTRADHQRIDIEALPFADASLDIALCNHVLEHVNDPALALRELFRCLKPGGVLIAQTPYAPSIKQTLELHQRPDADTARLLFGQDDHVRLFGSDIVDVFHAAGFQGDLLHHETLLPDVSPEEAGCNAREPFFVFWKAVEAVTAPAPAAAQPVAAVQAGRCDAASLSHA